MKIATLPPQNFSMLSPDCILNALDSIGFSTNGSLLALNSYENRVYQVGTDDNLPVIAKFYRPGRWTDAAILEEHLFIQELIECEIPVVPPLILDGITLHRFEGYRFAIFQKQSGRAPELENEQTLEWMGRFLGRIHAVGALKSFSDRPTLDISSFGEQSLDYLLKHKFIPADIETTYSSVVAQAMDGIQQCFIRAGEVSTLRLHGDCHVGNVLCTEDGPHFVDFDDSRMGPAIQDIWMLLSGDRSDRIQQLNSILTGYEVFCDFNSRELHLIEALRTLRLIHYTAWLARRWDDPAFKQAFPWFNTQRYWQDHILELREQITLMNEPSL